MDGVELGSARMAAEVSAMHHVRRDGVTMVGTC